MTPKEEANNLIKEVMEVKGISINKKEAIHLSIFLTKKILNEYEKRFKSIAKSENVARVVLSTHWNRVNLNLNKILKAYINEEA